MKAFLRSLALAVLVLSLFSASLAHAAATKSDEDYPTTPTTKSDGSKWRLGYMEGGQYHDYQMILKVILLGLQNRGWLEVDFPEEYMDHRKFWEWLSDNARSDYLEFVKDGYFAPGDFEAELRPKVKEEAIQRLAEKKDIDLMLALGTWAGQDLANDRHSVPVVVASSSDPVGSGIVKSAEDSGFDHVHAKVEPERYERQIRLFHDIVPFQKLGIVYEDSPEGHTYAAVDAVREVAAERGFELVECHAPFNDVTQEQANQAIINCYKEIAPKVDAAYITVHRGVNPETLPQLLDPLYKAKVPTFSMLGTSEVQQGALMSIAQAGFRYVGQFHADVIARILNGAKARALSQEWQDPPKIALNLKVAEIIGYDPPVDIMMAADEIFEDIKKPEKE